MKTLVYIICLLSLLGCAPKLPTVATPTPKRATLAHPVRSQVLEREVLASDIVYVRVGPGREFEVLGTKLHGQTVTVDYLSGNWAHLRDGGYIFRGCLSGLNTGLGCK